MKLACLALSLFVFTGCSAVAPLLRTVEARPIANLSRPAKEYPYFEPVNVLPQLDGSIIVTDKDANVWVKAPHPYWVAFDLIHGNMDPPKSLIQVPKGRPAPGPWKHERPKVVLKTKKK